MTSDPPSSFRSPSLVLGTALVALIVGVIASQWFGATLAATGVAEAPRIWVDFLAVWVPMLIAVGVFTLRRRIGGIVGTPFFRPSDLLWGAGVAFLARLLDAGVSIALTGSTGLSSQPRLGGPPSTALLIALIVAPVLVAPVVEELFYRGLVQSAVSRAFAPRGTTLSGAFATDPWSAWTAAIITALAFGVTHVVVAPQPPILMLITFVETFMLGLGAGALVVTTRRIGAAMVAHIVFNAIGIWLTWPR